MPVILLIVVYLAFIGLGLPDGIFGIAWPSMRIGFNLPLQTAGYINVVVMCCCALTCFTVKNALYRFGTGVVTLVSCMVTGLALLGYSLSPSVIWLVALAIPLGLGKGAIDTGLNYYVSNHYSSRCMSWLHCCWGGGATLGTLIMTRAIALNSNWRKGYSNIVFIQFAIVLVLLVSIGLWKGTEENFAHKSEKIHIMRDIAVLKSSAALFSILLFFIFTGIECTVSLWANSMFVLSRHISKDTAGLWISLFYATVMAGRFLSGVIVNKLGNRALIRMGLLTGILGSAIMFLRTVPFAGMIGLLLIGLGLAPIFPCMMHETPRRFDKKTSDILIGYQVGFAYLGGSALPALLGLVFSSTSLEMLTPCLVISLIAMLLLSEKLYLQKGSAMKTS